jgi:hyperosmotically inducible protein
MWTRTLAAAVLLMLASGAAAQQSARQLFREVQRQVLTYPQFTVFDSIKAEIRDGGVVILRGKVTMDFKRNDIERRVRGLRGVERVENGIDVLPASKFDNDLRNAIANAIYGNAAFSKYATQVNPPIHIIVERGRVTLEGVVVSQIDRQLAYSLASSFNAFSVKNELRTEEEARKEVDQLQG